MLNELESLDEANHDIVGNDVLLQRVDLRLLIVAQIAQREGEGATEVAAQRELLAERGRADEGGGHDIAVVVALAENLVVGLPVVGTEHQPHERQLELVAEHPLPAEEREAPRGNARRHDVECETSLCRVVGIAAPVVEHAQTERGRRAGLQVQSAIEQLPGEVAPEIEVVSGLEEGAVVVAIGVGGEAELVLNDGGPARPYLLALGDDETGECDAGGSLARQVGVEDVAASHTQLIARGDDMSAHQGVGLCSDLRSGLPGDEQAAQEDCDGKEGVLYAMAVHNYGGWGLVFVGEEAQLARHLVDHLLLALAGIGIKVFGLGELRGL